jgi:hypothetical protein
MRSSRPIAALIVAVALGAALLLWPHVAASPRAPVSIAPTPAPIAATSAVATATPPAAPAPPSKYQRVLTPRAMGKSAGAWVAYRMLVACRDDPTTCGDTSPGQVAGRQLLLDVAAAAGVHGAFDATVQESARSTDLSSPDDLLDQWHERIAMARQAGVEHGDAASRLAATGEYIRARDWANIAAYEAA